MKCVGKFSGEWVNIYLVKVSATHEELVFHLFTTKSAMHAPVSTQNVLWVLVKSKKLSPEN